jgi:hypothetical protein
MSLTAEIQGRAQLRRLGEQIKATGDKGLGREMAAAIRKAAKPIEAAISREADAVMPSAGGYRATFSKSMKFRVALRIGARRASLTMHTFATGTKERRDIGALNKGTLRHPVFGRSRRIKVGPRAGTAQPNPWSVTAIRPDFFGRGTAAAGDVAEREIAKVRDEFSKRLAKG